jgi:hypothetical protein
MFTFETADQKLARRFRVAQFNGRTATFEKSDDSTVTGHVRSVLQSKSSIPGTVGHHDRARPAHDQSRDPSDRALCSRIRGRRLLSGNRLQASVRNFEGQADLEPCPLENIPWCAQGWRASLHGRMQESRADKVCRIPRSKLSHRLGAMTLEGPGADPHQQSALLVGMSLADQTQNLALALRQRLLARAGKKYPAGAANVFAVTGPRLPPGLASGRSTGSSLVRAREPLHDGADALGLLQRILYHLLQINPIPGGLRKLVTVLFEFAHIEQKRGQWPV